MPQPHFYIDVLRDGLQWLLSGPPRDPSHPAHDPAIWLVEAEEAVFDDSGIASLLESPLADDLLTPRLRKDLLDLSRALREAASIVEDNAARARAQIQEPTRAVLADLE